MNKIEEYKHYRDFLLIHRDRCPEYVDLQISQLNKAINEATQILSNDDKMKPDTVIRKARKKKIQVTQDVKLSFLKLNMKKYGHTGTLFIDGGKYKWSYKYNHCVHCKNTNSKHKGRGLCTKCHDKERYNSKQPFIPKGTRAIVAKIAQTKFGVRKRVKFWMNCIEKKNMGPAKKYTMQENIERRKEQVKRYSKKKRNDPLYREINRLLCSIKSRKSRNIPCMQIVINGTTRYFPFDSIPTKPVGDIHTPEYIEYKRVEKEFEVLRDYYNKVENGLK